MKELKLARSSEENVLAYRWWYARDSKVEVCVKRFSRHTASSLRLRSSKSGRLFLWEVYVSSCECAEPILWDRFADYDEAVYSIESALARHGFGTYQLVFER